MGDHDSQRLCALLKASSPKIYKDQLRGAQQVIAAHTLRHGKIPAEVLERILTATRLTASQLRDRLEAYQLNPVRLSDATTEQASTDVSGALAGYAALNGQSSGQEVSHVRH